MPEGTNEKAFVERREARDKTLAAPNFLFQSVRANVDGEPLPKPHPNEVRYLKIPINVFRLDEPAADLSLGPATENSLAATR
ncbi:MAG: hypothetical protein ACI81R_003492 [Bradymonadia bacterium]|jgi:hypothetical protein